MAIKKSELYSSIWASCDALRGGMDASQYKDYVLVLLFVKYVSDKYAGQPYAPIVIPKGASFKDMVALKGKPDIGDQINKKILGPLASANSLADIPDFNDTNKLGSGKEMVDRLTELISIFENPALDFSKNQADGDDLLGDAYEYLMRHFATESGKSKGQFYTPAEVSRVIAQILGIRDAKATANTTVYDPTCGSGSLLLKVGDEAARGRNVKVTLYGQEKDASTAGLARMNMILHDYATAEIKQGNTLTSPQFTTDQALKTFDYVVANPPFSDKRWSTGLDTEHDPYQRFSPGVPPDKQGDYAYLLHILRSIKPKGQGACILPHGVLFRGNAEETIRRNLIERGVIKAIIGLPANLFYGTGIPACIILLDKDGAAGRAGIFMVDASKGFRKDGNKNRLREQDLDRIVDTVARQVELPGYSRLVPVREIASEKNNFNLNLPRYIDSSTPEDLHDIDAHLHGGIPDRDIDALASYWQVVPAVRSALFDAADRPGYSQLRMPITDVKRAILDHDEFAAYRKTIEARFAKWRKTHRATLLALDKTAKPKALIETLSEELLTAFDGARLLDPYDVYQHLMDGWDAGMQDDVYLIAADGWVEAAKPKLLVEDKTKKSKQRPDLVLGKKKYVTELIPPALVIARYFAAEQRAVDKLEASYADASQQLEAFEEEHGGDDGLLSDARNDNDKLTAASVSARLREVIDDADARDEREVFERFLELIAAEVRIEIELKAAKAELNESVFEKYGALDEDAIKTLVVDDKWLAMLETALRGELDRVGQTLTGRVRELAERYAQPLPALAREIEVLAAKVDGHLAKMGLLK